MKDYPFIRADCASKGSMPYYLEAQLERARKDKAPHTAVYFNDKENRWIEVQEMVDSPYRASLYHYVGELSK